MMLQFIVLCYDIANGFELRAATRPAHLDYIKGVGDALLMGGPHLNDDGKPVGSMLIIEMEDLAAAQRFADADPYNVAGLFRTVSVLPYKMLVGSLVPQSTN